MPSGKRDGRDNMAIESLRALMEAGENQDLCDIVIHSDCVDRGVTKEASFEKMRALYAAIRRARAGYDPALRSASGMVGGDGAKMRAYVQSGKTICGDYIGQVIAQALEMGESNACMKCIVAAPTAGSCGVLPAVLLPLWRSGSYNEEAICRALYVSAGFGQVVAARATLAGAEGGCQAEVGAASAMAAAALVELRGGTAEQCAEAFAMALTNLEGLVCDPVAGLVEIPCIKRNVIGAMNAVSCADMALAGVVGHIPADEVIDAMAEVGAAMSNDLRETGIGGLAGTPTGKAIRDIVQMQG